MMGGDQDASSKGVFGIASSMDNQHFLLILDPHYYGKALTDATNLYEDQYIVWKPLNDFLQCSFYNMCMPQISPPEGAV